MSFKCSIHNELVIALPFLLTEVPLDTDSRRWTRLAHDATMPVPETVD
jgi:hypothetical protein